MINYLSIVVMIRIDFFYVNLLDILLSHSSYTSLSEGGISVVRVKKEKF